MVRESEVIHITTEKKTLGGDTYWIEHPEWVGEERAICFRKLKAKSRERNDLPPDSRCSREAGWGTWHLGEGACRTHGGSVKRAGNGMVTGKGATTTRSHLKQRIDEYIESGDRENMLDLTFELASLRVLLKDLIDNFPEPDADTYTSQVNRTITMIQATGSLVDKMSRIESRNSITVAQVMYLRVAVADILAKYITDIPMRERAMKELMSRVQGGEIDEETRMVAI